MIEPISFTAEDARNASQVARKQRELQQKNLPPTLEESAILQLLPEAIINIYAEISETAMQGKNHMSHTFGRQNNISVGVCDAARRILRQAGYEAHQHTLTHSPETGQACFAPWVETTLSVRW